jgi:Prohead core protein serine protease
VVKNSLLVEHLTYDSAKAEVITESSAEGQPKNVYMKGIFIQGDIRNHNGRIYPVREIRKAVNQLNESIKQDSGVLGECDHPQELQIHLDRVSHKITEMWMDGANGYGKLQILPTPHGQIINTLLTNGVKLGVSSRGSGNVDDNGEVSDFDMLTVDIVAKPSAPQAYPTPMYEAIMNRKHGYKTYELAEAVRTDAAAQKHLTKILLNWVDELKLR